MSSKAMSLKGRIKNIAKSKNISAQVILQNFMFECLLERLSVSKYKDKFVLKGGMLIAALVGIDNRATMDLDTTLRNLSLTQENVIKTITEICAIELDDEVIFTVKKTEPIRKDDIYGGLRVSIDAVYDTIITPLSIDVSTGDAITPSPVKYTFSGIFDETKEIELWAYNIETVLAEKVETILRRGELNTRPRDFYDIHILCTTQKYDSEIFKNAFWATAEHRGSAELIKDVHSIVETIKTSTLLQNSWKRYSKEYKYSENISYEVVTAALENITETL